MCKNVLDRMARRFTCRMEKHNENETRTSPRLREDLVLEAAAAYAAACPQHFRRPEIDLTVAVPLGDAFSSPGFVVR